VADYQYIAATGVIVPDTTDTQATVEGEYKDAFGNDLIVTPNTPQGVLITVETVARDGVIRNNAGVANQINPNQAGGVFLDAIWALTGGQRFGSIPSLVQSVLLTGQPGSNIPAGAQASVGAGGPVFQSVSAVELGPDGTAVVDFQSLDNGPIGAPATQLDTIVSGVIGWETVSNPADAIPGRTRESDQKSRARRRNTLALQGVNLPEAILSEVNDVEGVKTAFFRENVSDAPVVISGVNLLPHSIYLCVEGGTDIDIADALLRKKSGGCNWNGDVTVTAISPASRQPHDVKFQRPAPVVIFMRVTLKTGSTVADPAKVTRDAILAYAAGQIEGEEGFVIGGDVSAFEIGAAINSSSPGLTVRRVEIGTDPDALSPNPVPINGLQLPTIIEGNIGVFFE
jgi:uncharacterized phage protein gp47/JayE